MRKNEIIKNLELLGQQIKMTDEQKQRSEDFIMSRIKSDLFIEEKNTVPIWLKLADAFVPANFRLQPVAVFSLVIGLFFVTSFASINASKNTLPGDPLYQIKITAEQLKYSLSFSEVNRTKIAMSIVEKRVSELQKISQNKSNGEKEKKVAVAVFNVKSSLSKVKDKLNSIKQEEKEKQEVIAMVKEIDQKLTVVKNEIEQSDSELAGVVEEVSVVALAVLNQEEETENEDQDGVIAGDQDKAEKSNGVITPQAASDSLLVPEPILVIEEIEKKSEEFGVGIGE